MSLDDKFGFSKDAKNRAADLLSALPKAILVWRFHEAPDEYKSLSTHGGDEDWLAVVPENLAGSHIPWLESGSSFGVCSISEEWLPDGRLILIGAHS